MRFASEELRDFWVTRPRVTLSKYACTPPAPGPATRRPHEPGT